MLSEGKSRKKVRNKIRGQKKVLNFILMSFRGLLKRKEKI